MRACSRIRRLESLTLGSERTEWVLPRAESISDLLQGVSSDREQSPPGALRWRRRARAAPGSHRFSACCQWCPAWHVHAEVKLGIGGRELAFRRRKYVRGPPIEQADLRGTRFQWCWIRMVR